MRTAQRDTVQIVSKQKNILACTAFYNLAEKNGFEKIISKRKDSKYYMGKRTKG